jgi:uncharacterized protein YqgC (DUF456 family)
MDWLLIIFGILLLLLGFLGAIVPGLPGPPLSFIALILLQFTERQPFTENFLIIMGVIMVAVTVLDYIVPIYGTHKMGGSKKGVWGSTIGLIVAIFVLPFLGIVIGPFGLIGIILGPFVGAYIGEKIDGKESDKALKAAIGSFIGFLAGTFMKFAYAVGACVYFFAETRKQRRLLRKQYRKERKKAFINLISTLKTFQEIDLKEKLPYQEKFKQVWPAVKPTLEFIILLKITRERFDVPARKIVILGDKLSGMDITEEEALDFLDDLGIIWDIAESALETLKIALGEKADAVIDKIIEIMEWLFE